MSARVLSGSINKMASMMPKCVAALLRVVSLLAMLGINQAWAQATADSRQAAQIKLACESLVLDYATHRDQRNGQAFAQLFTVDGTLLLNGETFIGHSALAQRLEGPSSLRSRHMMSNIRISVQDGAHATGVSYALIFIGNAKSDQDLGPSQIASFTAMGEYHDDFVRTDAGWRIAKRRFVPVFLPK
jgi:Tfp pilus assembly protein PilV